jgi:uncharacterized damage-inducible protein DinB
MASQLVEAWRMSNEANLFLLDSLPRDALDFRYAPRTRTVAGQFAHMVNVRVRWLTYADRSVVGKAKIFPRGAQPTKTQLKKALTSTEKIVTRFLEKSEDAGKVKNWNGPPATFLGYLVAHEAHHRGLALAAVRLSGHKLPKEVVYGLWDWGKKSSLR